MGRTDPAIRTKSEDTWGEACNLLTIVCVFTDSIFGQGGDCGNNFGSDAESTWW